MGGIPKNYDSDEFLSSYLDGELSNPLHIKAIRADAKTNSELRKRLSTLRNNKDLIKDIFKSDFSTVSSNTHAKISELVFDILGKTSNENFLKEDATFPLEQLRKFEILISKFLDDELSEDEAKTVATLLETNDEFNHLYSLQSESRTKVTELLNSDDFETEQDFQNKINRAVEDELNPSSNVVPFPQRIKHYVYQAIPLAAVFVFGLVLSPALLDQVVRNKNLYNDNIVVRGGYPTTTLPAPAIATEILSASSGLIYATEPFVLNLLASENGELSIFYNSTTDKNARQLAKGEKFNQIFVMSANKSLQFPETGTITMDEGDTFVRFDFELRTDNGFLRSTKIIPILQK